MTVLSDAAVPDLAEITGPADIRALDYRQLSALAARMRGFLVDAVSRTGGHLGSNLGVVELTLALHRVFDSPRDVMLWDTGHQAYVHKLVTGRAAGFSGLRQAGGLSGYPRRSESPHDWIENSHASTVLAYAHGVAEAVAALQEQRRVVAVIGDGSLTGGMAFEGLNNLGRSGLPVTVVLNDNGRSYAPTASRLPERLRSPRVSQAREQQLRRVATALGDPARVGRAASAELQAMYRALGENPRPEAFFHSLGLDYLGPVDGHDIPAVEAALRAARRGGPVVVHVVTQKGRGYIHAEQDEEKRLHDVSVFDPSTGPRGAGPAGLTRAFSEALLACAQQDPRIHAITAAMPGPTGLLPFQQRFPDRFHDVGIAEQHAVTMAAGMAMAGLRPVVAVYSTFLTRAFDQLNLDVGLHALPVVFALDRAGITGDDGPSHHGVLDLALCSRVPGMTVLAPSGPQELAAMLRYALTLPGPVALRWQKGTAAPVPAGAGTGGSARRLRAAPTDRREVCILAVGRMVAAALGAARTLQSEDGRGVTVWDVRCAKPLDRAMLADAAGHRLVITVEDGYAVGGVGSAIAAALADTPLSETALSDTVLPESAPPGRPGPHTVVLGVPDEYIAHGKPEAILAALGLDAAGITAAVRTRSPAPAAEAVL